MPRDIKFPELQNHIKQTKLFLWWQQGNRNVRENETVKKYSVQVITEERQTVGIVSIKVLYLVCYIESEQ